MCALLGARPCQGTWKWERHALPSRSPPFGEEADKGTGSNDRGMTGKHQGPWVCKARESAPDR